MELHIKIRQRREELNMTQDELAQALCYKSRSSINKIELGKSDISYSKIEAFAEALKTTPEYLMGLEEHTEKNNATDLSEISEDKYKKIMSQNIQYYMNKNHKSRNEMCHALGIKYTTFTDWIKGNTYPRIDKIDLMANYFGICKSDLIDEHLNKQKQSNYFNQKENEWMILDIGTRIKALRTHCGMSQNELAQKVGYTSRTTISKIESGDIKITTEDVVKFAKSLNTTIPYLMGLNENESSEQNQPYYLNPEISKIAQQIYDNKELYVLFNAAQDAELEDLQALHGVLMALKRKENRE